MGHERSANITYTLSPRVRVDLFHVSSKLYAAGDTIGPYAQTMFTTSGLSDPQYVQLKAAFEALRPQTSTRRNAAIFAFISIETCWGFWDAERLFGSRKDDYSGTPHYYRVLIPDSIRAPMALVTHAYYRLQLGQSLEEVVSEYWSPAQSWQYWEYLGNTVIVDVELSAPTDRITLLASKKGLSDDRELAKKLWPLQQRRR